MPDITQIPCPQNRIHLKCPYPMTPTRIVIHNTANDASAQNEITYMHNNLHETSFHFAVDDVAIIQGIDLNRNAWHAGDGHGKGNMEGIAIEICYSKSGGERWLKAVQNAAGLTAKLLHDFGWGIDRVTKHEDYAKKHCPHRILDEYGWQNYLNLVQKCYDGQAIQSQASPEQVAQPQPQTQPQKKSNEQIAQEVLQGKWGNGADRKAKITAAGYDFSAIQNVVNSLCGKPSSPAPQRKSNEQVAREVLQGKWGNGLERRTRLTAAGFHFAEIQGIVNQLCK